MTCRELIEFLDAYLGGELAPLERAEFDRHLGVCRACRGYLASYERTIELGRTAFEPTDDEVPAEVPSDLVDAILKARQR